MSNLTFPNIGLQRTARLRLATAELGSFARPERGLPLSRCKASGVVVIGIVAALGFSCAAQNQNHSPQRSGQTLPQRASPEAWTRITAQLARYRENLALSISLSADHVTANQEVIVRLGVTNSGDQTIEGCIGSSRDIRFDGSARSRGLSTRVGHPYCKSTFHVDPKATFTWTDSVRIPDVGEGPARVSVSQSIVYGSDCDVYGCYDTRLEAAPAQILVGSR